MTLKFNVGDKVLYTGSIPALDGQEVEILSVTPDIGAAYLVHKLGDSQFGFQVRECSLRAIDSPAEYTGGSVSYYSVDIDNPTSGGEPYTAQCNDLIEALGMTYAEGNAFKAIWRLCAARTLGKAKASYKDGVYDSEKVVFFGERMVVQEKAKAGGK